MTRMFLESDLRRKATVLFVVSCIAFILGVASSRSLRPPLLPDPTDQHVSLDDVERAVAAIHSAPQIMSAEVARLLEHREAVLFDVRERREFDAGHLPEAIHVEPGESAERFLAKNGEKLKGRIAIFYCAVGLRSSAMLERVASAIGSYQPMALYNLRGGIFRWFAEGRTVVSANGPAVGIDPYDDSWGKLLQRTLDARS